MLWAHDGRKWNVAPLHKFARGQCAILCCPGPSFGRVDPDTLRGPGRLVIGVNNTYPRLRPDYWLGMDDPDCFEQALFAESFPKVMRGNYGDKPVRGRGLLREIPGMFFADVDPAADLYDWTAKARFHWSGNSFFIALQFALWLGCREIYFIGVDLSNAQADYHEGSYLTAAQRAYNARLYDQTFPRLKAFAEKSAEFGVRCISGSEGSRINACMPFIPAPLLIEACEKSVLRGRPKQHVTSAAA